MAILQEFLNNNLHRNYPITDNMSGKSEEGEFILPTELIADLQLVVPAAYLIEGCFFISQIVIRRYSIDIFISYAPESEAPVLVGAFHNISTASEVLLTQELVTVPQTNTEHDILSDSTGSITIGYLKDLSLTPGLWLFSKNNTEIISTVISSGLSTFRSLEVNGTKHTGNIILKAGNNIDLSTEYDSNSDTTTITISSIDSVNNLDIAITDDASIMEALVARFGQPITTINNVKPDALGNFEVVGADCTTISTNNSQAVFENPCSVPCCDKDDYLPAAYEAINQVNVRHVKLEEYSKQIDTNLEVIKNRLKNLENSTGFF